MDNFSINNNKNTAKQECIELYCQVFPLVLLTRLSRSIIEGQNLFASLLSCKPIHFSAPGYTAHSLDSQNIFECMACMFCDAASGMVLIILMARLSLTCSILDLRL